ncbi:MAG: Tn3 family transposase [Hyphomicrobiales bacterium]|nr:Tn3 family transposase [Hyphomicrobiales bacterium]
MSTDDPLSALHARRRRALLADPSEDELARHWSLTPADLAEVARCRGDDHRRRFALQLCMLRAHGRFLDDYRAAPLPIVNHLSRQLGLAPVLFLDRPSREPTEREQAQRIRRYLGLRDFDAGAEVELREWLRQGVAEGRGSAELLLRAEDRLRSRRIMLPAASTLDRIVHSEAAHATAGLFATVAGKLPEKLRAGIALLLEVPEGDARSSLFRLKRYPTIGTPPAIKADLARLRLIDDLLGDTAMLDGIDPQIVRQLGELGRRYDAGDLRRFAMPKREALVACYLIEARKSLLDQLVDMHDQFLTTMARRSRLAVEERHRKLRRRARDGLHRVLGAIDALHAADGNQTVGDFRASVDAPRLLEATLAWREYERLEERGLLDAMLARYAMLRQYLPGFLALPFQAASGSEALLRAIELARALDASERAALMPDDPVDFVPAAWRPFLIEDGKVERRIWDIALALAVRDALRAGNLFLSRSRNHVSFWNLIHDERSWQEHGDEAYRKLNLPTDTRVFLDRIAATLYQAAKAAAAGLPRNCFAKVENGRIKLKQPDAMPVPRELRRLRDTIRASMPRVRIEDLLQDVDEWCGFTRAFQPLGGYTPRGGHDAHRALLATLIAHGTNLGLAAMSQSTDCLTAEALQDTSRWFLRDATLKAANTILVDYHHQLPISRVWGNGSRSSSDGQRFAIERDSLLGAFYPRYFGYYQRVLTVYTHTSDQNSVYATQVISCAPREALYVLNGILDNDTALRICEHTSDTHGATEQLFGICALLGIDFMPRLKDLADQVLYRIDRDADYGALDPVLRGTISLDLIAEQWDQLVRIVASLKDHTAPADVVLQRLINAAPADRLAKALTALGSLVKTIHILRYIHDAPLRQAIQLQLNRGEFRHILAKWLFFANQGDFRVGDYEEIMNKASCLSLLSNAVLVWNTVHIARIVAQLRAGGHDVKDEDLARVSPLLQAHTVPSGSYFQSPRRRSDLVPQPVMA